MSRHARGWSSVAGASSNSAGDGPALEFGAVVGLIAAAGPGFKVGVFADRSGFGVVGLAAAASGPACRTGSCRSLGP